MKSLAFILPTNIGEALLILVAVAFFPVVDGNALLPVLPVQILWINLVATVALALPLAFEAKEPDLMRRSPRRPGTPLLGGFVGFRTVLVAVLMATSGLLLFLHEYRRDLALGDEPGLALREAQTMVVTTVVLFQIFYLFNCRSLRDSVFRIGLFTNPAVWLGIGGLLVLQAGFVYLPVFHTLFGSAPLDGCRAPEVRSGGGSRPPGREPREGDPAAGRGGGVTMMKRLLEKRALVVGLPIVTGILMVALTLYYQSKESH